MKRLSPHEYPALEQALGDSIETVIPLHQLREDMATATLAGPIHAPQAVVIQANDEPTAFGVNAAAVWAILQTLSDWFCVEIATSLGSELAALAQADGKPARLMGDIYYALEGPLHTPPPPAIETRLLTPADIPVWRAAPQELNSIGFADHHTLLARGAAAGSFVNGQLVALAQTFALSSGYADVGVFTAADHRDQGLATYAAALVMAQIRKGRTPVWSTGQNNIASQRVAQKLGLVQTLRRCYLIFDK